ncbi:MULTISPECIES: hypothetical protein [unclassified Ensifer]|uniref:hypothetical protein n=1 Tax=unclassified Ensifer TaxID=2633371 RepID=UPI001FEEF0D9|nr:MULTISPECIES: hypothetical protein [unclassified Ensifer]
MNQKILLAIAASVGLAAGAGGTYLATSGPDVDAQAISKAELVAAMGSKQHATDLLEARPV